MWNAKNWKKLITERPRDGGTRADASRVDRNLDRQRFAAGGYDALPKHAPLLEHSNFNADKYWYEKRFTDHLGPLKGWLRKQVGRPWADVYAEMGTMVDRKSTTGAHVFEHLMDWVHTAVVIYDDGEVWAHGKSGPRKLYSTYFGRPDYYVHPETGRLCLAPMGESSRVRYHRETREYQAKTLAVKREVAGRFYEKLNGCWFEVRYEKREVSRTVWHTIVNVKHELFVVWKRQLGKKEMRDLQLVNGEGA